MGDRTHPVRTPLRREELAGTSDSHSVSGVARNDVLRTAILDSVFDGILAYDAKGRPTYRNRSARELFGELADMPVDSWPEHAGLFDARTERRIDFGDLPVSRALTGESMQGAELMIRRPDGTTFYANANARAMYSDDGELTGAVISFRDVTSERQAREELIQAQRLDALGQLTGGIAHDFNNVLSTMLGSLQLLQRRVGEDARAQKYVEMCLRAAKSGGDLTARLLAFSRRQKLKPETIQVSELLAGLTPLLRRSIEASIRLDIAEV
ncbi:MAG: PAS domain S-box protein, partial [Pseudomonadota bacterium]|nr:PAS domain S-box protein [Pseudomonadota bacterium]